VKNKDVIIIKKIKKHVENSHGGSWKVAYADFVTALMAFFLLLWLLSMTSQDKRIKMAAYFKQFSIFTQSGTSFMDKSNQMLGEAGESSQKVTAEKKNLGISSETQSETSSGSDSAMKAEEVKETIRQAIEDKLGDIKDQILVDIFEGGLRIQLVDKAGKPMFELGSFTLTPIATRILKVIAESINPLPNPVSIEGHTDSLQYRTSAYSNWELSTQRALTARKQLEVFGLPPSRLSRVAGYADTVPLITEDTEDPRNRRISIILFFPQKQSKQP